MHRIIGVLLLLSVIGHAQAQAGSIAITVTQGGQPTLTKTYTIPDADIDRIIATFQPQISGTPTRTQIVQFWIDVLLGSTKLAVSTFERQKALEAVPAPTPIDPR